MPGGYWGCPVPGCGGPPEADMSLGISWIPEAEELAMARIEEHLASHGFARTDLDFMELRALIAFTLDEE